MAGFKVNVSTQLEYNLGYILSYIRFVYSILWYVRVRVGVYVSRETEIRIERARDRERIGHKKSHQLATTNSPKNVDLNAIHWRHISCHL